ncbi:exopolysaccharide biosynthesis protein [Phycisphaera mikurensis]|uniref:ExoD family protein n=1 Tax=Phycisphaera mikurensis (strain NBRC 102666 / KCTC 22515 / FYK2301M01) TaxID=1142394 RepID=I0IF55_PHYMF|nr:exopolysaccharide biosynthesis protein [Phycisphaera mikurensis]MBB6440711.1 hypothetical protein [Phycisphaera mikurensis]BAM03893.1 ExoD family protein [Phycisphaera mikurensis NBRC 102666]
MHRNERRSEDSRDLEDVLDTLKEEADGQEDGRLTLGEVIDAFRHRPAGTLLLVPAVVMVSPLGAIPSVPTVTAALVALIAAQMLFARSTPWVPGFLRHRGLAPERVISAVDKSRPVARFLDRFIRPRLQPLTGEIGRRVIAIVCVLLSVLTPPLELVPFAVYLPGTAILLLSLALVGRDGLLAAVGLALAAAGLATAAWTLL